MMFIPECFKIKDQDTIYELIEQHSFATLISQLDGKPYATHLPLVLHTDEQALYGHIAQENKQWIEGEKQQVLAIFQGPHCYISPTYYETTKAVPTWDYVSVHVYGKMEIIKEKDIILQSLTELVNKYEKLESPYNYQDLEPRMIDGMIGELVAFKIKISKIEAQGKLSQNHPAERQELIIKHLERNSDQNDKQVAALMRKNLLNQ